MNNQKRFFISLEALLLAAISLTLYFILPAKLFLEFIELSIYQIFPPFITTVLILVLNITWLIMVIKFSFIKNVYIKIILTWILLVVSTYIVYCLLLLGAYSGMR